MYSRERDHNVNMTKSFNKAATRSMSKVSVAAIIVALLLLESVASATGSGVLVFLAVLGVIFGIGFAVVFSLAKKKGKSFGSLYSSERAKEKAKHIFMREEFNEEAVSCTHPRGKEKYIQQLDNFLANGLIDKAEYRVLKERHERANVPNNMH